MNYVGILLTSLLGTHLTYRLSHTKWGAVRSSAFLTLAFVAATHFLPFAVIPKLQAAFFGATFVGMSRSSRLGEKEVLFASALFAVVFSGISQFHVGIGGTLGAAAFVSCLLVFGIRRVAE